MELGSHGGGFAAVPSPLAGASTNDVLAERLLGERIVVVGGEIDDAAANTICSRLVLLAREYPRRDITLHINSTSGSASAATAIYDTMQWIAPDVATLAQGTAASAALLLLTAGAPGKRTALPHAKVVLHQPRADVGGTASDVRLRSEQLARQRREIAELIARHSGRPVDQIVADSERDRWFSAAEAVEYGLVDRIAERA